MLTSDDDFEVSRAFKTGLADTRPAENTKDPTPISINDVPQVSTFAKRLGKTLKSTSKIAKQVTIIIVPRYAVMNGLIGSGSKSLPVGSSSEAFPRILLSCFLG